MALKLTGKTLKNGLRVAVIPQPQAATVTAIVLVGVGAGYETAKQNGLSHFLEHMCFKGTVNRPSAKEVLHEIESLGAVTNAFTDYELTGYHIKGNPEHIDSFIEILADIYRNSTLPEPEIQKEKGVIIEEINMYEDMPNHKVVSVLFDLLYKDQAMGRSILGTKETVSSFTHKDFARFRDECYTAANTVVVIAGNVTPQKGIALVQKHFNDLPASAKNKKKKVIDSQTAPAIGVFRKETDQAHFALAFRAVPMGHEDVPAIKLLATILGRGMSSRLSLIIREELGAAYYVYALQETFLQNGIFHIAAGVDKTRLREIIGRITDECKNLKKQLVLEEELSKAKEYAIGLMRLGLELSDDIASFYGGQLVLNQKVETPEQKIKKLKAVTAKDVQRVARKLFQPKRANLAVVGPFAEEDIPRDLLENL